jgi:predicted TIM-barrel fold metal-dependent hydrolase
MYLAGFPGESNDEVNKILFVQSQSISPNEAELSPYFALAEELDIAVGIQTGLGDPIRVKSDGMARRDRVSH